MVPLTLATDGGEGARGVIVVTEGGQLMAADRDVTPATALAGGRRLLPRELRAGAGIESRAVPPRAGRRLGRGPLRRRGRRASGEEAGVAQLSRSREEPGKVGRPRGRTGQASVEPTACFSGAPPAPRTPSSWPPSGDRSRTAEPLRDDSIPQSAPHDGPADTTPHPRSPALRRPRRRELSADGVLLRRNRTIRSLH